MGIISNFFALLRSFAIKESYAIGYRSYEDGGILCNADKKYTMILPARTEWYADPFLFEYQDKTYLFAEIMKDENRWRGVLGVCCLSAGETKFTEVLCEDFHLSYPFVFQNNGVIYMLPETYQSHQLRLYKCIEFPYHWVQEWIILDNVRYVDTTLFFSGEQIFAETHDLDEKKNIFYKININDRKIHKLEDAGCKYIDRRPGGGFVHEDGKIIHVLQHNDNVYGEYLHVAEVKSFDESGLCEEEIAVIKSCSVCTDSNKKFKRIHTYNKTDKYEVIDLLYDMIIPEKFFPALFRYVKNRFLSK